MLCRDQSADDAQSSMKGRLIAASQFKKKMAREVKEIIDDAAAAQSFLKAVAEKKLARKRRNI